MKSISITIFAMLLLSVSTLMGQDLPKDGAILSMKKSIFTLKPGVEHTTSIELLVAKRLQQANFGGLMAGNPDGITISFVRDNENSNLFLMTLLADEVASKDSYTIIIQGKGENSHRVRGTTMKVNIDRSQMVTANQ